MDRDIEMRTPRIVVGRVLETDVFYVGIDGDNGRRVEGLEAVLGFLDGCIEVHGRVALETDPKFVGVRKEDEQIFRERRSELLT